MANINQLASAYPWTQSQFNDSLQHHDTYLLSMGGLPIGFAIYQHVADESCLLNIAIHPQHQRCGYAYYLLEQGLQACQLRGSSSCYLEVRESNTAAIALYKNLGFIEAGLRKNYYPLAQGREHAVVMTVALNQ